MPTPIPTTDKNNFISRVAVRNPVEANRLAAELINYEDISRCIGRQLNDFVAYPQYLISCMDCFTSNPDLITVGIYYNQIATGIITNPSLFISSTTTFGVVFTTSTISFGVLGASNINEIKLGTNDILNTLYIGPSSIVDVVDTTAGGCCIQIVNISFVNNSGGRLNMIKYGGCVGQVNVSTGAYYGGIKKDDPVLTCALPVTGLTAGVVTHNTFELIWTPPVGAWLFINPYYKLKDAFDWIKADTTIGDTVDNTGYIFRQLLSDTFYDFKVEVICANGGVSSPALLSQQTNNSTVITK